MPKQLPAWQLWSKDKKGLAHAFETALFLYYLYFLIIMQPLCPPNPSEALAAASISSEIPLLGV